MFLNDLSSRCLESGLEEGRNESQETVKLLAWLGRQVTVVMAVDVERSRPGHILRR